MATRATKTSLFGQWLSGNMVVADQAFSPGRRFFVDSGGGGADTTHYGSSPERPFLTLDYAVEQCVADRGDIVYLLPGHAENVASATEAVVDVAGVSVIGIGRGSLMPTLTLITAAGATLSITAPNCSVQNVHVVSAFTNGVTAGVTLGALADGCTLDGLLFTEALVTQEFLIGISIAADCDDVIIRNCRYCGTAGGDTTSAIAALGGTDRTIIRDNYINVDASAAAIKLDAAASTDLQILRNRLIQNDATAGLGIDCSDTSTGMFADNRTTNLRDTVEGHTGNLMCYHENYGSNAVNVQGILEPVVDA